MTPAPIEALRTLFLDDRLDRPLTPDKQTGGLVDRAGHAWVVFDIDGTREAARQRAVPQTDDLPLAFRRLDDVCAPGYTGRKRGQVVRTRTTVSQAHSYHWLGSFGNKGNGRYREELRKALGAIGRYLTAYQFPQARALVRLDGQYGLGAVVADVASFAFVTRGKEYTVLDCPLVQARLHLPPDQMQQRPESQTVRSLYDCPEVPVGPEGVVCRVVVATHPATEKKSPVGVTRAGVVYERFFTNLPQQEFTVCDVVELYLHRGAFESTLADEDQEIDPDRWCSHTTCGKASMVHRESMGVEPTPGTGPSTQAGAVAHHRVCESSVRNQRTAISHLWIWQADGCHCLQSRPFLGAGLLTIDGMDTAIATPAATINTLSGPLMIQSLAVTGVDFINGKVTIDTNGNLIVNANITAKTIHADKYEAKDSGDNASVGEATIPAGQTQVEVKTKAVTAKSQIFTSPKTLIDEPLVITHQDSGTSFTVEIAKPFTKDIQFGWWLIN